MLTGPDDGGRARRAVDPAQIENVAPARGRTEDLFVVGRPGYRTRGNALPQRSFAWHDRNGERGSHA